MTVMASGQITLVDMNDNKQLQLYINSSQPKTQIFNPNDSSYTPNWTTVKPVLTPQLFVAGISTDIIGDAKSIQWFIDGVQLTASNTDYTLGTGNKSLTILKNVLASVTSKMIVCEVVYTDTDTGFDIIIKADIELIKVSAGSNGAKGSTGSAGSNGSDGADAVRSVVWTPNGNVVRNSTGTLVAQCDFYKGAGKLTSGVTYQWYVQDPSQSTDAGGGIGWKKLSSTYTLATTGYTTATLTIPASAIPSVESFKCVATYNAVGYQDVCTVSDVSDPIQVVVTGTSVFKNGQGTVTLSAKLYQAGVEIDASGTGGYTYTWAIYNADNTKSAFTKTGKNVTVSATDISGRGNLVCEVS